MIDKQTDKALQQDPNNAEEIVPFSVGKALREARMQQNFSIDDVYNRIKFAQRQIEALEADNFTHLPETAFLRGFVRSYCSMLQIDPAPLVAALPQMPERTMQTVTTSHPELPYPTIYTEHKSNIIWLSAALIVAIILALAWLFTGQLKLSDATVATVSGAGNSQIDTLASPQAVPVSAVPDAELVKQSTVPSNVVASKTEQKSTSKSKNTAKASLPSVASTQAPKIHQPAPPIAANSPVGKSTIQMSFPEDSWVEVRDNSGRILMSQLAPAGSVRGINGVPPFSVTIGHASGVKLRYKGKQINLSSYTHAEVARLKLD